MRRFDIKVRLPSGKETRITELTNRHYLQIIKFSENQDLEGLNAFFNEELFRDNSLDIIDRFFLAIFYRMMFVSGKISFQMKTGHAVDYDLNVILEKIQFEYENYTREIKDSGFIIALGLPNTLFFNGADDLYNNVIKEVTFKERVIDFRRITRDEQDIILSHLPHSIFFKIKDYINNLSQALQGFVVIEGNEEFEIQRYEIDILSNGVMGFICSLFSGGLGSFYSSLYHFTSKLHGDSQLFYDLTPLELRVIFNLHNNEIEEQNRQLKNQQH